MQQRERALSNTGPHGLQCSDEVGPEQRGVVVALIERDPCCRPLVGPA